MAKHWLVMEGDGLPAPFRTRLAGAGRHLPATHLTTDELMGTTRHNTHIDLERLTGIRERRVSIGDEDSYSLATSAALDGSLPDPIVENRYARQHSRARVGQVESHCSLRPDGMGDGAAHRRLHPLRQAATKLRDAAADYHIERRGVLR